MMLQLAPPVTPATLQREHDVKTMPLTPKQEFQLFKPVCFDSTRAFPHACDASTRAHCQNHACEASMEIYNIQNHGCKMLQRSHAITPVTCNQQIVKLSRQTFNIRNLFRFNARHLSPLLLNNQICS